MHAIHCVTDEAFRSFGRVIAFPKTFEGNFHIVADDEKEPWRLAVFRYENRSIRRIECHPDSMESFEPLSGTSILLAAPHEAPEAFQLFLLDRPIILEKGVWHQVAALSETAMVKITENRSVYSVYYDLPRTVLIGGLEEEESV